MTTQPPCPYCAEPIDAGLSECPYCRSDLRKPQIDHERAAATRGRRGLPGWAIALIVIGCILFVVILIPVIAAIAIPGLLGAQIAANERNASSSLRTLAVAEMIFQRNDRDNNGVPDFWVLDVAGLYALPDKAGQPLREIDPDLANADFSVRQGEYPNLSSTPQAKSGYCFSTIPTYETPSGDRENYDSGNGRNLNRFAFVAYPEKYGASGRKTFIVSEENSIFWKDLEGKKVTTYPSRPEAEGWSPLDR